MPAELEQVLPTGQGPPVAPHTQMVALQRSARVLVQSESIAHAHAGPVQVAPQPGLVHCVFMPLVQPPQALLLHTGNEGEQSLAVRQATQTWVTALSHLGLPVTFTQSASVEHPHAPEMHAFPALFDVQLVQLVPQDAGRVSSRHIFDWQQKFAAQSVDIVQVFLQIVELAQAKFPAHATGSIGQELLTTPSQVRTVEVAQAHCTPLVAGWQLPMLSQVLFWQMALLFAQVPSGSVTPAVVLTQAPVLSTHLQLAQGAVAQRNPDEAARQWADVQSAVMEHTFPSAHLAVQDPPQSTSVSLPSFTPSKQSPPTHLFVVRLQTPLVQSALAAQVRVLAQVKVSPSQYVPPQSVSVSIPSFIPSWQVVATHLLVPKLQTPLVQSLLETQFSPLAHLKPSPSQVIPPQSTSVSTASLIPSGHDATWQTWVASLQYGAPLGQSALALQPQTPVKQSLPRFPFAQTVPHAPQLLTSVFALDSQPFAYFLSQSLNVGRHVVTTHALL